jgi:hypothetical protein
VDTLEFLIMLALAGLLILLRFDARRFGAADFDDEEAVGGWRTWARRLTWYGLGVLLVFAVYFLFPQPMTLLHLQMGEPRTNVLLLGVVLGLVGTAYAAAYAWWRFGDLRLPPLHRYPAAFLNSTATAFIDEAAFRGILLGLLLFYDWPLQYAIAFQAVIYALATRLGAPGRPRALLLLSLLIGLVGGWLTTTTAGIGAAFLAHALTRFGIFIATGHAGQVTASTTREEEAVLEGSSIAPAGWEVIETDSGPAQ